MTPPVSPLTKKNNTALSDTFLSGDVVTLYKDQLDIDVSPFFKDISSFHLYQCNDTGYRFYFPEKLHGNGKFYEALQMTLGPDYYHEWKFEHKLAYDQLSHGEKILDIGCGTGNFLHRAKSKTDTVYGLELNENAVSVCITRGLNVFNQSIEDHAKNNSGEYDMVCMFQVLEHIYDVKSFLEAALKVLKKGGKLIIGVPNSEPYFLGYDKYCTLNLPPHHMGLWNSKVFEKFSALFNLSVLKVEYDIKGRLLAESYVRAKYLAGVKSLPGQHLIQEKIRIAALGFITFPATIVKKIFKGLHGSHMAVVFLKN